MERKLTLTSERYEILKSGMDVAYNALLHDPIFTVDQYERGVARLMLPYSRQITSVPVDVFIRSAIRDGLIGHAAFFNFRAKAVVETANEMGLKGPPLDMVVKTVNVEVGTSNGDPVYALADSYLEIPELRRNVGGDREKYIDFISRVKAKTEKVPWWIDLAGFLQNGYVRIKNFFIEREMKKKK